MYTALLLDDEEKGRSSLQKLVGEYCPEVNLIAAAATAEQAYQDICKYHPQLLFLDIEIGQSGSAYATSFELLAKLPKYNYEVIFVTAYEHYAFRAIQNHAVGYVLKPLSIGDLVDSVNEGIEKLQLKGVNERLIDLANQVNANKTHVDRIWIHSQKDIVPVSVDNIIRFEAQGKYTDIYCDGDKKVTSSKNIGEFIDLLDSSQFVKVHRSHIVNIGKIAKFSKADGGWITTTDGAEIPVSRNGKDTLQELL